jgi:two-component system response regulator YesN
VDVNSLLEIVRHGMEQENEETVMEQIDSGFRLACPDHILPRAFRQLCHGLILILEQYRERMGQPLYTELAQRGELNTSGWYQVQSIRLWFREEFSQLLGQIRKGRNYSQKVQQAIWYIHRNYKLELTLDLLGDELSVSGEHLRHVFKEETGRTVMDYLTWYRMEKAKALLKSGHYKVYEVSDMVGYKTSQYFSLVFKKWTGMIPLEFWRGGPKADENADQIENHH